MAGERKGVAYEAIIKIALDELVRKKQLKGHVFWNDRPDGMTIEPDFTVGADKNHPTHVFLVTHSSSAKNSDMKFWRNIGELAEAKVRLPKLPCVYSVVFDAIIKQDLKDIQKAAFDGQIVIGDSSYGSSLILWIDSNFESIKGPAASRAEKLQKLIAADSRKIRASYVALVKDLQQLILRKQDSLDHLWVAARKHRPARIPVARNTSVRRGLTKALLLDFMPTRSAHTPKVVPSWVTSLGFMTPSITGLKDPDLAWLARSKFSGQDLQELLASTSVGFRSQLIKVRSAGLITEYAAFVQQNLARLKTKEGMLTALMSQYRDPMQGLTIPPGVEAPRSIWLLDIIGAIIKAKSGKAQAFGYTVFAKAPSANARRIGNMPMGTWCSCFMNQWFNRLSGFSPPKMAVEFSAQVLADVLKQISTNDIANLAREIKDSFLSKELEATLLSHRGFDPIGFLVHKAVTSLNPTEERISAGFAERANLGGSSGATRMLRVQETLIKWQSVTDEGRDHKKKELCGRAPALRYSWDAARSTFIPRPRVKKLFLVVDGTWRQEDLDILGQAGWDALFYADEMDDLTRAIV